MIFNIDHSVIDTEAPTITVSQTGNSGSITLNASASDYIGVTKVEFYVDGAPKGTDTSAPFSMVLDSLTLSNGNHQLQGKAYDAAGNVGSSNVVSFNIDNGGGTDNSYTETENNGTTKTANIVGDSVTKITGFIGTATDHDVFAINVAPGRTLTVNMKGPARDYDLYLLSSAGKTLKTSANVGSTETVTYKNASTSTARFYIKVVAFGGANSASEPYMLSLNR